AAGIGSDSLLRSGTAQPVGGSALDEVLATAQAVYREDTAERSNPEEVELLGLGLHCRLAVPLFVGGRAVGMLSLARVEAASFREEEIELVSLLGRFLGSAVQNIRADEAERTTVAE